MNVLRCMKNTILTATLIFTATAGVKCIAGSADYFLQVKNNSPVTIKAVILHSDGSLQKTEKVKPGGNKTFSFGGKCSKTKTRGYRVTETLNNAIIASGTIKMTAGAENGLSCRGELLTFVSCIDSLTSDPFSADCITGGSRLKSSTGRVTIN